jgi:hypothetical protein
MQVSVLISVLVLLYAERACVLSLSLQQHLPHRHKPQYLIARLKTLQAASAGSPSGFALQSEPSYAVQARAELAKALEEEISRVEVKHGHSELGSRQ